MFPSDPRKPAFPARHPRDGAASRPLGRATAIFLSLVLAPLAAQAAGASGGAEAGGSARVEQATMGGQMASDRAEGGMDGDKGTQNGQNGVQDRLEDQETLQGTWDFQQPRDPEGLPDALKYKSMSLTIQERSYSLVKDGKEVAKGTLKTRDGRYPVDDRTGGLYAFESLWLSGANGKSMTACYQVNGRNRFIDVARRPEDSAVELARFLKHGIQMVDIVRTDRANAPTVQFNYGEPSQGSATLHRGRRHYNLEGTDREALAKEIDGILGKYAKKGLEKLRQRSEMPPPTDPKGDDADCLYMYFRNTAGLVHSLYFRGDVPKVADRLAKELEALFQKYESRRSWPKDMKAGDVVGTWVSEDGVSYEFKSNGTYTFGKVGGPRTQGRYAVQGDQVLSDDLIGRWSLGAFSTRHGKLGEFDRLEIQGDALKATLPIMDAPRPITVIFMKAPPASK